MQTERVFENIGKYHVVGVFSEQCLPSAHVLFVPSTYSVKISAPLNSIHCEAQHILESKLQSQVTSIDLHWACMLDCGLLPLNLCRVCVCPLETNVD